MSFISCSIHVNISIPSIKIFIDFEWEKELRKYFVFKSVEPCAVKVIDPSKLTLWLEGRNFPRFHDYANFASFFAILFQGQTQSTLRYKRGQ